MALFDDIANPDQYAPPVAEQEPGIFDDLQEPLTQPEPEQYDPIKVAEEARADFDKAVKNGFSLDTSESLSTIEKQARLMKALVGEGDIQQQFQADREGFSRKIAAISAQLPRPRLTPELIHAVKVAQYKEALKQDTGGPENNYYVFNPNNLKRMYATMASMADNTGIAQWLTRHIGDEDMNAYMEAVNQYTTEVRENRPFSAPALAGDAAAVIGMLAKFKVLPGSLSTKMALFPIATAPSEQEENQPLSTSITERGKAAIHGWATGKTFELLAPYLNSRTSKILTPAAIFGGQTYIATEGDISETIKQTAFGGIMGAMDQSRPIKAVEKVMELVPDIPPDKAAEVVVELQRARKESQDTQEATQDAAWREQGGAEAAEPMADDAGTAATTARSYDPTVRGKASLSSKEVGAEDVDIIGRYKDGTYRVRDTEGREFDLNPKDYKGEFEVTGEKQLTPEEIDQERRTAIEVINQAVKDRRTDKGTAMLARMLVTLDPSFDANTALAIMKEARYATEAEVKRQGLPTHGKDGKRLAYEILGSTQHNLKGDFIGTSIQLYRGHNAHTVLHEWLHRAFFRLNPEAQRTYKEYHEKTGDTRPVDEHFAEDGSAFLFSEKFHELAGPIRKLFEHQREGLADLIERIRQIRGATIDPQVMQMYRDAVAAKPKFTVTEKSPQQVRDTAVKKVADRDYGELTHGQLVAAQRTIKKAMADLNATEELAPILAKVKELTKQRAADKKAAQADEKEIIESPMYQYALETIPPWTEQFARTWYMGSHYTEAAEFAQGKPHLKGVFEKGTGPTDELTGRSEKTQSWDEAIDSIARQQESMADEVGGGSGAASQQRYTFDDFLNLVDLAWAKQKGSKGIVNDFVLDRAAKLAPEYDDLHWLITKRDLRRRGYTPEQIKQAETQWNAEREEYANRQSRRISEETETDAQSQVRQELSDQRETEYERLEREAEREERDSDIASADQDLDNWNKFSDEPPRDNELFQMRQKDKPQLTETEQENGRIELKDQYGGRAFIKINGDTANIIDIQSVPREKKYSDQEPEYKRRGFFRSVINYLGQKGYKTLSVKLQSGDTQAALKRLVETGEISNPRDLFGSSFNEYPTTFDISMPQQESFQMRRRDEKPALWYSKISQTVESKMGGSMPKEQLVKMIKSAGIKDEELEYSGLLNLPDGKITKQQAQDALAENAIQIEEVWKGENKIRTTLPDGWKVEKLDAEAARQLGQKEGDWTLLDENGNDVVVLGRPQMTEAQARQAAIESAREAGVELPEESNWSVDKLDELKTLLHEEDRLGFDTYGGAMAAIVNHADWTTRWDIQNPRLIELGNEYRDFKNELTQLRENRPKFASYQTAGGKDYFELLLRLPEKQKPQLSLEEAIIEKAKEWDISLDPKDYSIKTIKSNEYTGQRDVKIYDKYGQTNEARYGTRLTDEQLISDTIRFKKRDLEKQIAEDNKKENFRSGHFDETNIIAHVRGNTRIDADGKKTLFVEEIQSDWHQKGREQGYKSTTAESDAIKRDEIAKKMGEIRDRHEYREIDTWGEDQRIYEELQRQHDALYYKTDSVPDAPFKKNWHELAFKRMLRYAVDNGYERIAWTTGEMQAERYDLSKQIDRVRVQLLTSGHLKGNYAVQAYPKNNRGDAIIDDAYPAKDLPGVVGKELADKIVTDLGQKETPFDTTGWYAEKSEATDRWIVYNKHGASQGAYSAKSADAAIKKATPKSSTITEREYSGLDLKVGGEGMKGFYDRILPADVNKMVKKYGARVTQTTIKNATETTGKRLLEFGSVPEAKAYAETNNIQFHHIGWDKMAQAYTLRDEAGRIIRTGDHPGYRVHSLDITEAMQEQLSQPQSMFQMRQAGTKMSAFEYVTKKNAEIARKGRPMAEKKAEITEGIAGVKDAISQAQQQARDIEQQKTAIAASSELSKPESDRNTEIATSARQADIAADRRTMGLDTINSPERRTWQKAMDDAIKEELPDKAQRIAEEINTTPRALSDTETAGMVIAATKLKNEHRKQMERLKHTDDPAEIAGIAAEAERIEAEFDNLSQAIHKSGTEKGRALASQKLTIDNDLDLVSVKARAKAAKNKPLTAEEHAAFADLTTKLDAATMKIDEVTRQINELTADAYLKERGAKRYSKMSGAEKDKELTNLIDVTKKLLEAGCYA